MTTPYEVLGVVRTASIEDIRQAYRRKAMKVHPDRPGGSVAEFQKLKEAFEELIDPVKREKIDRNLQFGPMQASIYTSDYVAELMKRPDVNGVCSVCRGEKVIREASSIFWTRKPCPKCQEKTR